jgi:hypothetical protein
MKVTKACLLLVICGFNFLAKIESYRIHSRDE